MDFLTENSVYILATLVVVLFTYLQKSSSNVIWPPGPIGWPIIGHLLTFGRDTLDKLNEFHDKYGKTIYFKMGSQDVIM